MAWLLQLLYVHVYIFQPTKKYRGSLVYLLLVQSEGIQLVGDKLKKQPCILTGHVSNHAEKPVGRAMSAFSCSKQHALLRQLAKHQAPGLPQLLPCTTHVIVVFTACSLCKSCKPLPPCKCCYSFSRSSDHNSFLWSHRISCRVVPNSCFHCLTWRGGMALEDPWCVQTNKAIHFPPYTSYIQISRVILPESGHDASTTKHRRLRKNATRNDAVSDAYVVKS